MSRPLFPGRTLARNQALQLLFQAEASGRSVEDILDAGDALVDPGPLEDYACQLALGADGMRHQIDARIADASKNWAVSRMSAVDRNLLRVAVYEIVAIDEVDPAVSIDEAVEITRAYGTEDSRKFVNGVLGRVVRDLEDEAAESGEASEGDAAGMDSEGERPSDEAIDEAPGDGASDAPAPAAGAHDVDCTTGTNTNAGTSTSTSSLAFLAGVD